MTEYIIIVALIAIAAIGVVSLFGDNIRALFATSADALAGDDAIGDTGADVASDALKGRKGMDDFADENAPQ
jgi:Flp pilus assembly pilin Flp